ncbi:2-phosphoxylose phosphatase 1 [Hetaerina americana]|uniref:2-phosphoxylose phosphatase 1 n=1 Tax=Hetaerina americana TaxID=62018 RepID=UPI003A7F5464
MRLTSQHRALYCYLMLMLWIFLLVAGMYKYIGQEDVASISKSSNTNIPVRMSPINMKQDNKVKRIFKFCNPPEDIAIGSEGQVDDSLSLEGVVMVMRHGSRGPLSHVRNLSSLHCTPLPAGGPADNLYRSYVSFVRSYLVGEKPAHPSQSPPDPIGWIGRPLSARREIPLDRLLGSFFGAPSNLASLPLLPPTNCQLGQLTGVGVAQMAKTGLILREVYAARLGLLGTSEGNPIISETYPVKDATEDENVVPSSTNHLSFQIRKESPLSAYAKSELSQFRNGINLKAGSPDSSLPMVSPPSNSYDGGPLVLVYSTRHRRTLQSALAFLHAFLPSSILLSSNPLVLFRDSHSVSFCTGEDCSCAAAEKLLPPNDQDERLEEEERLASHPAVARLVKTAAATILEVPGAAASPSALTVHDALLAFVCHGAPLPCHISSHHVHAVDGGSCLHPRDLSGLSAYLEWEGKVRSRRKPGMTRALLLRAYGIVRAIVGHILRLMSQRRSLGGDHGTNMKHSGGAPRFVLYSGHDTTLRMLGAAFGVPPEGAPPQYASRFIIEVYRKKLPSGTVKNSNVNKPRMVAKDVNKDVPVQDSIPINMKSAGKMHLKQVRFSPSMASFLTDQRNVHAHPNASKRSAFLGKAEHNRESPLPSPASSQPAAAQYYFRLVYNGKDMTNQVPFCKESFSSGNKNYYPASGGSDGTSPFVRKVERQKQSVGYLCPIEAIVRFLHDNYFSAFNATNFKDSCLMHS